MLVGLLGLQGAFLDHIPHLQRCCVEHVIVRDIATLKRIDRLIIPGGESTVMTKFLLEYNMRSPLLERVASGMPVWGVCAGAILLAERVDDQAGATSALGIAVTRNAYGRQAQSTLHWVDIPKLNLDRYPAIFIRAPRIDRVGEGIAIHASYGSDPIFVQKGRIMATTFHPELNADDAFHRYFISL